jgi:hypothetical protein
LLLDATIHCPSTILEGVLMKLKELAAQIGAAILTQGVSGDAEVEHVYAGNRVSDLLNEASSRTLIVTSLLGPPLLRLADLMDVTGICFAKGSVPSADMVEYASKKGTWLMVSPFDMLETHGRLKALLAKHDCS